MRASPIFVRATFATLVLVCAAYMLQAQDPPKLPPDNSPPPDLSQPPFRPTAVMIPRVAVQRVRTIQGISPSCPKGYHGEAGPQRSACVPDCPKGWHPRTLNDPDLCIRGNDSSITLSPVQSMMAESHDKSGWEASVCDPAPLIEKQVDPVYTEKALQMRRRGTFEFLVRRHEDGSVENLHWGGDTWLKDAAEDAMKQWRWRPFLLHGKPIAFRTVVFLKFELTPDGPRVQTLFTKPEDAMPALVRLPCDALTAPASNIGNLTSK